MRFASLLFALALVTDSASAQFADDFSDGDFTRNPTWTGTASYWSVLPYAGTFVLSSNGPPRADTLYLATSSPAAYGEWRFRFAYDEVNLSNFNGARVFLVADRQNLLGDLYGYFLQFGTNNSNEVRLYRMDGDPRQRRIEIGRTDEPILSVESADLSVIVTRSATDEWDVIINDQLVIQATDGTYRASSHFGFWIKHTSTTAQSYFFGDVAMVPGDVPAPDPVWIEHVLVRNSRTLDIEFSGYIGREGCEAGRYTVNGRASVADVVCEPGDRVNHVQLELHEPLITGLNTLAITGLVDEFGSEHPEIAAEFVVHPVDVQPFDLVGLSHEIRMPHLLTLQMSREVDEEGLTDATILIESVGYAEAIPGASEYQVVADFSASIPPGVFEVHIDGLTARNGEVYSGSVPIVIAEPPRPLDIVINEIHFDPCDQRLEFIELYNTSERPVDLSHLDYADDRLIRSPITSTQMMVGPDELLVLARDTSALFSAYPGIVALQPSTWHTLNNGGDAVILYAGDVVVDSVAFRAAWGAGNASLERVDPRGPSLKINFRPSVDPSLASPGRRNSVFSTERDEVRVIVAEETASDQIEIVLTAPVLPESITPAAFEVDAGAALSVEDSGDGVLTVRHGARRPRHLAISGLIDLYGAAVRDTTIDVAAIPAAGELVISEIMYEPLADPHDGLPDQPEYLEVSSLADRPLTLSQLAVADAPDENGVSRYIVSPMERPFLAPSGIAVYSAEPDAHDSVPVTGRLALAYPDIDLTHPNIALLPVRRASLSLPRGGRLVRLVWVDKSESDVELELDAVHYQPSWHHRAAEPTVGRSLERIDLSHPAQCAHNWTTSVATSGGTPGGLNSVARTPIEAPHPVGITLEPNVFSPDDDGFDDLLHISYRLQSASALVRVRVFDSRGRLVRRLGAAGFTGPVGAITWDGHDDEGRRLPIGPYIIILDAADAENAVAEAYREVVVLARPLGR